MTLAEVLTALGVLSIGLVAMISLLPLAGSSAHEGGHRSGAVFLAAQRLEEIRRAAGFGTDAITFPDEATLPPPYTAFGRAMSIRDCGVAPGCSGVETVGVRQVTVTVTYPAVSDQAPAASRRSAVVLSTYIGPR